MITDTREGSVVAGTPQSSPFIAGFGWSRDPAYYHRADAGGIGFDRTETGSNAVSRYQPPVRARFGRLETCPEEFLLWFHRVPWDYRMRSGRSLWDELALHYQHGVDAMREERKTWDGLAGAIDAERHADVAKRLAIQEHDAAWGRDAGGTPACSTSRPSRAAGVEPPRRILRSRL